MKTLWVRISDNVLDPVDWPVRLLELEGDVVVRVEDLHHGVYSWEFGPDVGWTIDQLEAWTREDSTGHHPESYHDVASPGRPSVTGLPDWHASTHAVFTRLRSER